MVNVQDIYNSKKGSVDEVLSVIETGDMIVIAGSANEPFTLLSNIHKLRDKGVTNLRFLSCLGDGKYEYLENDDYKDFAFVDSFFYGSTLRDAFKRERCSFIPSNLHDCARRKGATGQPNVYLGSATPMDKHGYVRTSLSNLYDKYYMETVDKIILEINPNLPVVEGDTEIHISQVSRIVEVNTPIPEMPILEVSEVERAIGENIASLINDGDTIQLGIGGIPTAVAYALSDKKDLGIHTEMIHNGILYLIEKGVVNNSKKTLHKGKTVGGFAFGSRELYDFLDRNPSILMLRGDYVNDPYVIAQNDNMVSINTALQVDLTGQVASETIGTMQYSGSGGQSDTAYGAIHAKNGRSIIALKSTTKKGTISTINACLALGSAVTLSRNVVDYIVTEYGIAPMRGCSIKERAESLINIAHPKFREQLREEAKKLNIR